MGVISVVVVVTVDTSVVVVVLIFFLSDDCKKTPVVRCRDTETAVQYNFRNTNCGSQFLADMFSNTFPKKSQIFNYKKRTCKFVNSLIEAVFVSFIFQLRVFTLILTKRMIRTIDATSRTISAARARNITI